LLEEVDKFSITLLFKFIERDESERSGIDAVTKAAFVLRTIVKHVAEVTISITGSYFRALHSMSVVMVFDHIVNNQRFRETRPSGLAVVLSVEANSGSPDTTST
jgi:hypothetical protein